jgi:hypothetical protein
VDSPRWPGQPADNTLPFRTGQVALYKQGGASIRDGYSTGWWLSDRTPLTGLYFAFAASALGVHVSTANVEETPANQVPMKEKDDQGFWAYQLVAMLLNLTIVLGVYLLARVWLGRRIATVAALVAAVMPGVFLNGIYTWPKQAVAYFVLVGAACAIRRRPVLAGTFAGLGYLTHPAGLFWIPAIALLLLLWDPETRAGTGGVLARFAAPLVVLVAPWMFFTSQIMHPTSRWTTAPLGYLMTDPTHFAAQLSIAWHDFSSNGPLFALWTRIQSTTGSLFPLDLNVTPTSLPGQPVNPQILLAWGNAHGFSIWGMTGVILFPFAIVHLIRDWSAVKRLMAWMILPALVFAELGNGLAYPFANQSMFPLVGVIAIIAASGLLSTSRRARILLVILAGVELLSSDLRRPLQPGRHRLWRQHPPHDNRPQWPARALRSARGQPRPNPNRQVAGRAPPTPSNTANPRQSLRIAFPAGLHRRARCPLNTTRGPPHTERSSWPAPAFASDSPWLLRWPWPLTGIVLSGPTVVRWLSRGFR